MDRGSWGLRTHQTRSGMASGEKVTDGKPRQQTNRGDCVDSAGRQARSRVLIACSGCRTSCVALLENRVRQSSGVENVYPKDSSELA